MRFGSMQLRAVFESALQATSSSASSKPRKFSGVGLVVGRRRKLLAADSHVLAFAAVTRASTKWQARYFIAGIFATEQSYYACARDRSWQNANPAQQTEPVRLPKRSERAI
jgi:hypothetical protein